jgi:hypothetical protein
VEWELRLSSDLLIGRSFIPSEESKSLHRARLEASRFTEDWALLNYGRFLPRQRFAWFAWVANYRNFRAAAGTDLSPFFHPPMSRVSGGGPGCAAHGGMHRSLGTRGQSPPAEPRVRPDAGSPVRLEAGDLELSTSHPVQSPSASRVILAHDRPLVGYLGVGPIPIEQAIVRIERPHMDRSLNERTNSRAEWCNTAPWMRCWSAGLNDENGSRMERMQILWRPTLSYALAILDEARQGRVRTFRSPRRCFAVSTLRRLTQRASIDFLDLIADCGCVA